MEKQYFSSKKKIFIFFFYEEINERENILRVLLSLVVSVILARLIRPDY